MGIVYKLALNSLAEIKQVQEGKKLTLANLKQQLLKYDFENEARVVCFNDCFTCKVILDQKKEIDIKPFLNKTVSLYKYDNELAQMRQQDAKNYFDKDNIEKQSCFSFRIFKNGASEQLYVKEGKKVYWLGDYFETKVYDSLDSAKQARENLIQKALL